MLRVSSYFSWFESVGVITQCLVSPQPVVSPLEGTKITVNNLHPRVTEEDIVVSASGRSHEPPPLSL